jgi:hypothetical protein
MQVATPWARSLPGSPSKTQRPSPQLDRAQAHRHRDRRRRHLAGDDRFHVLDAGHRRPGGRGRDRVLPDQRAAPGRLRTDLGVQLRRLDRRAPVAGGRRDLGGEVVVGGRRFAHRRAPRTCPVALPGRRAG